MLEHRKEDARGHAAADKEPTLRHMLRRGIDKSATYGIDKTCYRSSI